MVFYLETRKNSSKHEKSSAVSATYLGLPAVLRDKNYKKQRTNAGAWGGFILSITANRVYSRGSLYVGTRSCPI
jgi:hypothetical protein